ncbi:hypothetical protein ATER59S_00531 [Aquamicrobium terrae]
MSESFAWFHQLAAAAEHTDEGRLFKSAGFDLHPTGGTWTAWRRAAIKGYYILVTDSLGVNHRLGDKYVTDATRPDRWKVSLFLDGGEHLEGFETATVAEALAAADRLDVTSRQFSPYRGA